MIIVTLKSRLEERNMSRYKLAQLTGIKYQIIDNYYKNKVTRYDGYILSKICDVLDCEIGDILQHIKEV